MAMITRIGTTARWSDVVVHDGRVYVVEVPSSAEADLATQAREVLGSLEALLENAGSSKAHLLMTTIYLDDIREIDAFNAVWDAWVPAGTAPVRACVQARLGKPGFKVEVQVVAAVASDAS
jgi:enamine deaminase RidA (YjgF/YER057c/UK114 family)